MAVDCYYGVRLAWLMAGEPVGGVDPDIYTSGSTDPTVWDVELHTGIVLVRGVDKHRSQPQEPRLQRPRLKERRVV